MTLNQAQLAALIQQNSAPAYNLGAEPVYRGVSTSGAVGGMGASTGPTINYGQIFSGITGAIAEGAQGWAQGVAMEKPLMTIPDQDATPTPPLGFVSPIPEFRSPPLSYLKLATA